MESWEKYPGCENQNISIELNWIWIWMWKSREQVRRKKKNRRGTLLSKCVINLQSSHGISSNSDEIISYFIIHWKHFFKRFAFTIQFIYSAALSLYFCRMQQWIRANDSAPVFKRTERKINIHSMFNCEYLFFF